MDVQLVEAGEGLEPVPACMGTPHPELVPKELPDSWAYPCGLADVEGILVGQPEPLEEVDHIFRVWLNYAVQSEGGHFFQPPLHRVQGDGRMFEQAQVQDRVGAEGDEVDARLLRRNSLPT